MAARACTFHLAPCCLCPFLTMPHTPSQVGRRIRDFEKLYDLVKNQRNKFVNLIQVRSLRHSHTLMCCVYGLKVLRWLTGTECMVRSFTQVLGP